jgi:hypothetical protein
LLRRPVAADNAAMEAEPTKAESPKRKRRWYQFSLRTLLIFVLICAISSAWFGMKIERKRRERDAVQRIIAKSGVAQYDYEIAHQSEPDGPAWVRRLFGDNLFSDVRAVSLPGGTHNDDDLALLDELTQVRELDLQDAHVTDTGLAHLSALSELERLNLHGTSVGDAGLKHLKGLGKLEYLDLSGTKTSDAAISILKDLTQLKELNLTNTTFTDGGADDLGKALPQLESMWWNSHAWFLRGPGVP